MTSLQQFSADVQKGLSSKPKYLSSRYFYDAKGDKIFIEIMNMPEYYLTRSEYEILQDQTESIVRSLNLKSGKHMELIELGAGDGLKTIILLKYLVRKGSHRDCLR